MVIGDGPEPQPLTYEGTQVKFVPSFKYLGSIITSSGDIRPEINRRRALAASALKSLDRPLWKQRHVSRRTKLRVYNSTILPILLYGSETWAMTQHATDRINGFDTRALRRIERIFWPETISNADLREGPNSLRQPALSPSEECDGTAISSGSRPTTLPRPYWTSSHNWQAGDVLEAPLEPDGST